MNQKNLEWYPVSLLIPELYYTYVGKFRAEKLITQKGTRYCIGKMQDALITFTSENMLMKFLTV